jgi:hypothetical protein
MAGHNLFIYSRILSHTRIEVASLSASYYLDGGLG